MTDAEPHFDDDKDEMERAAINALNELTRVKAYTLTDREIRALKAAQYGLRVLSPEHDGVSNRENLLDLIEGR